MHEEKISKRKTNAFAGIKQMRLMIQSTTGKSFCLFIILFLTVRLNTSSNTDIKDIDYKQQRAVANLTDISNNSLEKPPAVVAEQDPNGVLWGLRNTVTGKLALVYTYQKIWAFRGEFATVVLDNKYGLINTTGKQIIEPGDYSPRAEMKCGFIALELNNGPTVIFNASGKAVIPRIYGMTSFLPCQQRITFKKGLVGMLNLKGDTILPFKFRQAHLVPEGFCIASSTDASTQNNPYGLYDMEGRQVLPHVFETFDGFYGGRAIVKKDGKYGLIDEKGKELVYTEYGRIDRFKGKFAIAYSKRINGEVKVGIIGRDGREVVPVIYQWLDNVFNFSEGLVAMAQNRKYGFVDTTGQVVVPFKYDKVESFRNGIAKVWVGWKHTGYINGKGEEIIPPDFEAMDQANLRRYHNKFIIGLKDSVQHVFDYSGKRIATLPYDRIAEFSEKEKLFLVSKKYQYGILDSNLRVRIPVGYQSLHAAFPGKIAFKKDNKLGLMNHQGKMLYPPVYDSMNPFQDNYMNPYENGLAKVGIQGKMGLINSYGKLIIPANYEKIEGFANGLALVKRSGKFGFVNYKGKEVIPAIYDKASSFKGYLAEVTLKGKTFQIDGSGKRTEEEE